MEIVLPTLEMGNASPMLTHFILCYRPHRANHHLPKLNNVAGSLVIKNYYALTPWNDIPSEEVLCNPHRALCEYSIGLPERTYGPIDWVRQSTGHSASEIAELDEHTLPPPYSRDKSGQGEQVFYTADLSFPLMLPSDKSFVPTFHSCLASRMYELRVRLKFEGFLKSESLVLTVPIIFR